MLKVLALFKTLCCMISSFSIIIKFATEPGVRLSLKGANITNNSFVDVDDIGENDDALLCHTNKTYCCDSESVSIPEDRAGEWYSTCNKKTKVETLGDPARNKTFYRNRGPSVVRLNRRGSPSKRGCFQCEVPDANNVPQTIFVNIGTYYLSHNLLQSMLIFNNSSIVAVPLCIS